MTARRTQRDPDPPQLIAQLAGTLQGNPPARGYVLRGEERYFHERAIELVRSAAERGGYEVVQHDAAKGDADFRLSGLIDDLSGGGLFHALRLVIVRHAEEPLKKVQGKKSPLTEAIERFIASEPAAGCVVLSASGLRADHSAVRAIGKAGGGVFGFRKLWDSPPSWNPDPRQTELVQWLLGHARGRGVSLDPRQAVYVCAATGNDLHALDDQLERLRTSAGRSVQEVVGWDASSAPWEVAEDLIGGDLPRALGGIETLFQGGFLEKTGRRTIDSVALSSMLLGSLVRGVRQVLRLATELEGGADAAQAKKNAGVAGAPRAVEAALQRARTRSPARWRAFFMDVLTLDARMKSGSSVAADEFCTLALRWRAERSS